ncbi:hypothetical protein [Streptomyces sp. SBT349]|uniref:hypothetical protein n=1 Tax=Streptomyces sp. SBT349 TaxID=1580539 RepID=UPI00069CBEB0|nr:hypothetical protein [Streptomyces sp. SBT349]
MSHPLTRRLAKAALLLAAGAVPVVGAAGQAAAVTPDVSRLALDPDGVSQTLGETTGAATDTTEKVGGDAVKAAMPVVAPVARGAAEDTGRMAGGLTQTLAHTAADSGVTEQAVGMLPVVDQGKVGGMPLL